MKSLDRMGARSIQWVQFRSIADGPGRNASLSRLIGMEPPRVHAKLVSADQTTRAEHRFLSGCFPCPASFLLAQGWKRLVA